MMTRPQLADAKWGGRNGGLEMPAGVQLSDSTTCAVNDHWTAFRFWFYDYAPPGFSDFLTAHTTLIRR
jgi:hypothetical protein